MDSGRLLSLGGRNRRTQAGMLFLLLLVWPGARAGRTYDRCLEESGGATTIVLECMEAELQRLHRRLNRLYDARVRKLPPARREALAESQRRWRAYRDSWCAFVNAPQSGSGGREDEMDCLLVQMRRRIEDFERLPQ